MNQNTDRLIFIILLAFTVFNLLLPGDRSPLTSTISQVVVLGLAAIYLLVLHPPEPVPDWVPVAFLLGSALVLSQAASLCPAQSLRGGVQLLSVVLLTWLIVRIRPNERDFMVGAVVLVGTGAVLAAIGLLQLATFFQEVPDLGVASRILNVSTDYLQKVYEQKRIFSTFVLPTTFSAFLAFVMPLAVALAVQVRRKPLLLAAVVGALALITAALIQAQSHGGPVALAAAVVLICLLQSRRSTARLLLGGAVLVAGICLVALIGWLRGDFLWNIAASDSSVRLRINLWGAGLQMLERYWLLGTGLGNFRLGLLPYLGPDIQPAQHLHNTYLQMAVEAGLCGLALVVAVTGLLARRLWRHTGSANDAKSALHLGFMFSAVVFLLANAFEIVLYFHSIALLGAFILGMWLSVDSGQGGRRSEAPGSESPRISRCPHELLGRAVRVSMGLFFIGLILLVGRWFAADHFYHKANDAYFEARFSNIAESAHQPLRMVLGAGPPGPAQDEDEAVVRGHLQQWNRIYDQVRLAAIFDDSRYEYHLLLGQCVEQMWELQKDQDKLEDAAAHYRRAVEFCPALPYSHHQYGRILFLQGKVLESFREAAAAARLEPTNAVYRNRFQEMSAVVRQMPSLASGDILE